MQLISHRGDWWPIEGAQNHPSSVTSARAHNWSIEIDVWGTHENRLKIGHDTPDYEWTVPADEVPQKDTLLFLHMKIPQKDNLWRVHRICEILQAVGWLEQTYLFWSPDHIGPQKEIADFGVKQLLTIDCREALCAALDHPDSLSLVSGFWLEQPEKDWIEEADIKAIHDCKKTAWVVGPELHGRAFDLASLSAWQTADGLCTDTPHLLEKLLDREDSIVHPTEAWWQRREVQ